MLVTNVHILTAGQLGAIQHSSARADSIKQSCTHVALIFCHLLLELRLGAWFALVLEFCAHRDTALDRQ